MRLLHTMLRVGNLDRSIDFYTNVLGMRLLRRKDYPDGKFTLAFVGYQDGKAEGARARADPQLGHARAMSWAPAMATSPSTCRTPTRPVTACATRGGKVTREAGPMKHGTTVIAFVEDPDGYKIEFIQKGTQND